MLTLVLSIIGGLACFFTLNHCWTDHIITSAFAGIFVFGLINVLINLLLKKRLEAAFLVVQQPLMEAQATATRKARSLGARMTPRLQAEIENELSLSIRNAISLIDVMKPFEKWNFMVKKQEDTLRAQLYFQIKDFAEADKYFPNALLMDPMIIAMQMVRFYKNDKIDQVEKCFNKGVRRFKDDKAVILYALYSWILVQKERIDDAIQVLVKAKTRAENEVLKQNWDHLVNGRVKRFSNIGLGEQWFALFLEAPRQVRVQQQQGFGLGGPMHRR